jgi:hypothetical protein
MPKRGPELDCGTRAVIAYSSIVLRKPLSVIEQEIGVPKSTCIDTRRRALESSKRTKLAVFHEDNQASYYHEGRPDVLSLRDKDRLILHGTANKEQRAKIWITIAFELGLGPAFSTDQTDQIWPSDLIWFEPTGSHLICLI